MSIFPIIGGCIPETRIGQTNGRPVIRTPLSEPYGTVDYSELAMSDAEGYAHHILHLVALWKQEQEKTA